MKPGRHMLWQTRFGVLEIERLAGSYKWRWRWSGLHLGWFQTQQRNALRVFVEAAHSCGMSGQRMGRGATLVAP